jgi:opine dehydrogenase
MANRRIAILGGGNGARTTAADMTLAGHTVTLFEFPELHDKIAPIFDNPGGGTITITGKARNGVAKLHKTTHSLQEVIDENPEIILIIVPALYHRRYAEALAPLLRDNDHVVLIPGTCGSLEFVQIVNAKRNRAKFTVSELDTLPYATRIDGPASVNVYHALPLFGIGTFPAARADEVFKIFKDLYKGVARFRDVLEAGLSNCNPVIHPLGVLMNAGRIEYSRGEFWYYEEGVTPSTARAMEALDEERLNIGRKLGLNMPGQAEALHAVDYGPKGDLWETLKGSKGLTPIKGPVSLSGRYITEDVPIGLVCWSQMGDMLGVPTPLMKATIEIGIAISGVNYWQTGRTLKACGIERMTAKQLVNFAKTGKKKS